MRGQREEENACLAMQLHWLHEERVGDGTLQVVALGFFEGVLEVQAGRVHARPALQQERC